MARRSFRELVEDALRIKIVPKRADISGIPISKPSEDIATRQTSGADGNSLFDIDAINEFRSLSTIRSERYRDFESMLEDSTITAAIEMYADDATQYDFRTGKVIWVESADADIAQAGNRLIDVLGLNEKAWRHIYSLCTYGDLYLRLYRNGDESDYNELLTNSQKHRANSTTIKAKIEDDSRNFEEYLEYVDDPATIYDLQVKDRTCGFVRIKSSDESNGQSIINGFRANAVNINNINIYDRTSFVHISLSESIERNPELLALTDDNGTTTVYKVKSGKSLLADAYEPSQTVKLLEDSLLLNRVTKSALVRILQIEVGDMPKSEVEALLRRIKNMIEQKMAHDVNNGTIRSYNSPAPIENIIYAPTKDGKGAITSSNLGGDVDVKGIVDVDYFNNKKLAALKIPKQFLNYDAPEGLGNGTSLTKLSSRYAHTVMRIQNAYISGVTTILNLFFMDKKLDYVNKFTVKMVSPSTVEDTERDEQMSTRIDQARSFLELMESRVEEEGMHEALEWIFANFLNVADLAEIVNEFKISPEQDEEGFDDFGEPISGGGGTGGGMSSGMGGSEPDFGGGMPDMGGSEPEFEPSEPESEE